MVASFTKWIEHEYEPADDLQLTVNKGSAYLDLETPTHLARVTLWDNGNCVMETMSLQEGRYTYWQDFHFDDWLAAKISIEAFAHDVIMRQRPQ